MGEARRQACASKRRRERPGYGLVWIRVFEFEAVNCASQRLLRNRLPARRRRFA